MMKQIEEPTPVVLCLLCRSGKSCEFRQKRKLGKHWKNWFYVCEWSGTCNQKYETTITAIRNYENQQQIRKVQKDLSAPYACV